MLVLGSIVLHATETMSLRQAEIDQRSAIGWQFVGDKGIRDKALFFEKFSHQFERCLLVSPGLNQDIKHFAFTIDSTPQIHALAIDGDKYLVEMPTSVRAGARPSQLVCISQTELHLPAPDALIGNVYAALGEHIFNIAKAEGKPEIEPDGVLNN